MTEGADHALFIGKVEPPQDIGILVSHLHERTEPGSALVTAANVEDWLKYLLQTHMRKLSNRKLEELFDGYGPLNTFGAKIALAYALELTDEETNSDLTIIKDIRNKFAHSTEHISFSSEPIDKFCRKFSGQSNAKPQVYVANQLLFNDRARTCVAAIKRKIEPRLMANALRDYQPGVSSPSPDDGVK